MAENVDVRTQTIKFIVFLFYFYNIFIFYCLMQQTLSLTAKIEEELYPIIATSEESPRDLIRFVDSKLRSVAHEIQQSEIELSQRIDKVDKIEVNDQVSSDKLVQVKNNLNSIKTKLFTINSDYH